MKKILLIACGEYISKDLIRRHWPLHDVVIAVDGGGNYLPDLTLVPNYVLGDLDSLAPEIKAAWQECCQFISYPVDKDETDLELGIKLAADLGGKKLTILGAAGSRLDHTLTNFGLLIFAEKLGLEAVMVFPFGEARLVSQNFSWYAQPGEAVSLIPLSPEVRGIKTSGLKFPLNNESLYMGKSRGVHNEVSGTRVDISVSEGWLLVFRFSSLL